MKMLTDGRTMDAGVTGVLIAHLGAFGSVELKNPNNVLKEDAEIRNLSFYMELNGID